MATQDSLTQDERELLADGYVVTVCNVGGEPGLRFPNEIVDEHDITLDDQLGIVERDGDLKLFLPGR
jgi:hypothetical protein